jgi:hypothetical protein
MKQYLYIIGCSIAALLISSAAHAGGFGFYGMGGYNINFSPDTHGANAGGGIMIDTAVAKPGFGYRFNLAGEWWQDYYIHIKNQGGLLQRSEKIFINGGRINFIHTFCFDLISNRRYKFWLGPQLHHGIFLWDGFGGISAGLGLAMGWNIHVSKLVSILVDCAVRGGYLMRDNAGYLWHGGNVSFHANIGIIFRFNDQNRKK